MMHKTIVPGPITREIRALHLGRTLGVRFFSALHHDLPARWMDDRGNRLEDERCYESRIVVEESDSRRIFLVAVDDSTSAEHLLIVDIREVIPPGS